MNEVCLSGAGRGEIQFLSNRYSFSFESVWDPKQFEWVLALMIPMQGEELIHLDYRDAYSGKSNITGAFYTRLVHAASRDKRNRYYLETLRQFLGRYAEFLKFYHEKNNFDYNHCSWKSSNGECVLPNGRKLFFTFEEEDFITSFDLSENSKFFIRFSDTEGKFYFRVRLYYENSNEGGIQRKPLQMDLQLNNCDL